MYTEQILVININISINRSSPVTTMLAENCDSDSDDGRESPIPTIADLVYENTTNKEEILNSLNKLRKARQFCDVTLEIGSHDVPAHKAVLATASSFLCELFITQEKGDGAVKGSCKIKDIDFESFQYLLEYIYTARYMFVND